MARGGRRVPRRAREGAGVARRAARSRARVRPARRARFPHAVRGPRARASSRATPGSATLQLRTARDVGGRAAVRAAFESWRARRAGRCVALPGVRADAARRRRRRAPPTPSSPRPRRRTGDARNFAYETAMLQAARGQWVAAAAAWREAAADRPYFSQAARLLAHPGAGGAARWRAARARGAAARRRRARGARGARARRGGIRARGWEALRDLPARHAARHGLAGLRAARRRGGRLARRARCARRRRGAGARRPALRRRRARRAARRRRARRRLARRARGVASWTPPPRRRSRCRCASRR